MEEEDEVSTGKLYGAIMEVQRTLKENTQSISNLTVSMDELKSQHSELKKDLMSFKTNTQAQIKALENSQHEITKSQNFLNQEFEKFKERLDSTEERAKSAEATVIQSKADIQILRDDLQKQHDSINSLEQYGRRTMLEINNIPYKDDEDLREIIAGIASAINMENFNYETDIDIVHRLQSKLAIAPIIILFRNRTIRNEFYQKRTSLRNVTLKNLVGLNYEEDTPIFINESLTVQNRILFKKVREACKLQKYKYYWTSNGVIMCKKSYESEAITIKNQNEVAKIK